MSVLTPTCVPVSPAIFPIATGPVRKRWSVTEFHKLWDSGYFEDKKPCLLAGEILVMPIPNPPHGAILGLVEIALRSIFGVGFWIRTQQPLVLSLTTDPIPDVAVVVGKPLDYYTKQPNTAVLVVEVSDTSLSIDMGDKASLYAAGRIADYWVVDINKRRVIVHRNPQSDPQALHGHSYQSIVEYHVGSSIATLAVPSTPIPISDIVPLS